MLEVTKRFSISGMTCGHCVQAVTKAVQALAGVSDVQVSLREQSAVITFDPDKVATDSILAAIADQGYTAVEQPWLD